MKRGTFFPRAAQLAAADSREVNNYTETAIKPAISELRHAQLTAGCRDQGSMARW